MFFYIFLILRCCFLKKPVSVYFWNKLTCYAKMEKKITCCDVKYQTPLPSPLSNGLSLTGYVVWNRAMINIHVDDCILHPVRWSKTWINVFLLKSRCILHVACQMGKNDNKHSIKLLLLKPQGKGRLACFSKRLGKQRCSSLLIMAKNLVLWLHNFTLNLLRLGSTRLFKRKLLSLSTLAVR